MLFSRAKGLILTMAVWVVALSLAGCQTASDASFNPAGVKAEASEKLQLLDQIAEKVLAELNGGHVPQARDQLEWLGVEITKIEFEGIASVEGVNALTQTLVEAQRVFNRVKFSPAEGAAAATKVRLAVDALSHRNRPMWMQYRKQVEADLDKLAASVKQRAFPQVRVALEQADQHYALLRPAMLISKGSLATEQLDSLFAFMNSRHQEGDAEGLQSGVDRMRQVWQEVFKDAGTETLIPLGSSDPPLIWGILIVLAIVMALAFTGWRKFRHERGYTVVRKKEES